MAEPEPVTLEYASDERIAVITLSRPAMRNALNSIMASRLSAVMESVARNARCRVAILTGAGEAAFCAGADLKERSGMTVAQWERQHRSFEDCFAKVRRLEKPIFAAVNGVALGAGAELAMSTDFIVCSTSATFGQPEVKLGIHPGSGGTQLLPRYLPVGMARQMLFTGDLLTAEQAHSMGLVNEVHDPKRLLGAALDTAGRIARNSPTAVQQAKRAARLGIDTALETGIDIELLAYRTVVEHPDRAEGLAAFHERRAAAFADVVRED
jgi:enoyl-CoA hydratase